DQRRRLRDFVSRAVRIHAHERSQRRDRVRRQLRLEREIARRAARHLRGSGAGLTAVGPRGNESTCARLLEAVSAPAIELGLYSFGEATPDPRTGEVITAGERLRRLVEEIELADRLGLDVFGVGEHHRSEFVVSTPAVVLAAAATRTKRIRLTSAVTVLSSDDPVRVFQDFATLDLISGGRAEIMAGRGSFTESFPLFGYDLADYDELFEEKLDLLLKIRAGERVTWRGTHRPPIEDLPVFPRPVQDPLPVWIAVGGHPESVVRAGRLGLPLALAIIGGEPRRFVPLVDLYRQAGRRAGHDPAKLRVSINSHGLIEDNSAQAADDAYAAYSYVMAKIGRERGWSPP